MAVTNKYAKRLSLPWDDVWRRREALTIGDDRHLNTDQSIYKMPTKTFLVHS